MTEAERDAIKSEHYAMLNDKLSNMTLYSPPPTNLQGRWGDLVEPQARVSSWDTGLPASLLQFVGAKSVDIPEHIHLHSHLGRTHVQVCPPRCRGNRPQLRSRRSAARRLGCRSWRKEPDWTGPRQKPWPLALSSLKVRTELNTHRVHQSPGFFLSSPSPSPAGFNIRISGQDVGRGTFSQRHAMVVCQDSNDTYIPLNHISPEQTGFLEVHTHKPLL